MVWPSDYVISIQGEEKKRGPPLRTWRHRRESESLKRPTSLGGRVKRNKNWRRFVGLMRLRQTRDTLRSIFDSVDCHLIFRLYNMGTGCERKGGALYNTRLRYRDPRFDTSQHSPRPRPFYFNNKDGYKQESTPTKINTRVDLMILKNLSNDSIVFS